MNYRQIQDEVIQKYWVKIDTDSSCYGRTHAHIREKKRICKWKPANNIKATFTLLHEVGHIMTTKAWMRRCEEEFYATVFALEECKKYGIDVPDKLVEEYQDYIWMELDRGIRRGGKQLPSRSDLILKKGV